MRRSLAKQAYDNFSSFSSSKFKALFPFRDYRQSYYFSYKLRIPRACRSERSYQFSYRKRRHRQKRRLLFSLRIAFLFIKIITSSDIVRQASRLAQF